MPLALAFFVGLRKGTACRPACNACAEARERLPVQGGAPEKGIPQISAWLAKKSSFLASFSAALNRAVADARNSESASLDFRDKLILLEFVRIRRHLNSNPFSEYFKSTDLGDAGSCSSRRSGLLFDLEKRFKDIQNEPVLASIKVRLYSLRKGLKVKGLQESASISLRRPGRLPRVAERSVGVHWRRP